MGNHSDLPQNVDARIYYGFYLSTVKYGDADRLSVLKYCKARLLPYSYGFAYEKKSEYPSEYRWVLRSPNFYQSAIFRIMERIIDTQWVVDELLEHQTRSGQPQGPQKIVEG